MLDFADLVAINKFDKRGSLDALRCKKTTSNHNLWDVNLDTLPVLGPLLQFNDPE
jgi:methylmalonyl-CoA mutase